MPSKLEEWKGFGKVRVNRDSRGRFVSWTKYVKRVVGKSTALYGTVETPDGRRRTSRYEFIGGTGRDLYRAIRYAVLRPPKHRFVTVETSEFLENPEKYSQEGSWIEFEVES